MILDDGHSYLGPDAGWRAANLRRRPVALGGQRPATAPLRDTARLELVPMDRLKPLPGVVRTHMLIILSTKEPYIVPAALPDAAHA
jgi:hypothetical protein